MALFIGESKCFVGETSQLLSEGQSEDLQRPAHNFKANGRDLGALRLAAVSQEIEDRAREGRSDGVGALIDEVEREAAQVCDALRATQVYARITVYVEAHFEYGKRI